MLPLLPGLSPAAPPTLATGPIKAGQKTDSENSLSFEEIFNGQDNGVEDQQTQVDELPVPEELIVLDDVDDTLALISEDLENLVFADDPSKPTAAPSETPIAQDIPLLAIAPDSESIRPPRAADDIVMPIADRPKVAESTKPVTQTHDIIGEKTEFIPPAKPTDQTSGVKSENVLPIHPPKVSRSDDQKEVNLSRLENAIKKTHELSTPISQGSDNPLKQATHETIKKIYPQTPNAIAPRIDDREATQKLVAQDEKLLQLNAGRLSHPTQETRGLTDKQMENGTTKLTAHHLTGFAQTSPRTSQGEFPNSAKQTSKISPQNSSADIAIKQPQAIDHKILFQNLSLVEKFSHLDTNSLHGESPFTRVQISQSQAIAPTQAPVMSEQARHIAQQLAQAMPSQAPGTTEITLNPEELGRVRMNLTQIDGTLTLTILSERPETADLMRRHIDQLAQTYRQLGYTNMTFNFAGGSQDQSHGQTPQSGIDTSSSGDHIPTEPGPVLPEQSLSGRLDLRF